MSHPPRVSSMVRRIELIPGSIDAQVMKPTRKRTQSAEMRPPPDQPNATWFNTLPSGPERRNRQRADWKVEMEAERQERRVRVREARGNLRAEMAEEEGQGRWAKQKGRKEDFEEERSGRYRRGGSEVELEADVNVLMGFGGREMEMIKREDNGNDLLLRSDTVRRVQEMVKREEWNKEIGNEPQNPFPAREILTRALETPSNPASPIPKVEFEPSTPYTRPHCRTIQIKPEPESPSPAILDDSSSSSQTIRPRISSRVPSPIAEAFYRIKSSPERSTPEPGALLPLLDRNPDDLADMLSRLLTPQPKPDPLSPTPLPKPPKPSHKPPQKQEYYIPTGALPSSFPLPIRAPSPQKVSKKPSSHTFSRVASPLRHSTTHPDLDAEVSRPKTELSYLRPVTPTPFSTPYGLPNSAPYAAGLHCIPGGMLEHIKRRTRVPSRRVMVSPRRRKGERGRRERETCVWWKVPFCRCCVWRPEIRGRTTKGKGGVKVRLSILDRQVREDGGGEVEGWKGGVGGDGLDGGGDVMVGKNGKKRRWWHFRSRKDAGAKEEQ